MSGPAASGSDRAPGLKIRGEVEGQAPFEPRDLGGVASSGRPSLQRPPLREGRSSSSLGPVFAIDSSRERAHESIHGGAALLGGHER